MLTKGDSNVIWMVVGIILVLALISVAVYFGLKSLEVARGGIDVINTASG